MTLETRIANLTISLVGQQAMPDDSWEPELADILTTVHAITDAWNDGYLMQWQADIRKEVRMGWPQLGALLDALTECCPDKPKCHTHKDRRPFHANDCHCG